MKLLLRNSAASVSVAQPGHPRSASAIRCRANRPSWNERCLNWYCAGESSVCASSVLMSGRSASSLARCSHSVNPSDTGCSRVSDVATSGALKTRRPASWLETAMERSMVRPMASRIPPVMFLRL
eukprot:4195816-Prymnesium_polylepis.1